MEIKLRELLDKIYELEGLIHLSLKREDAYNDFVRLIKNKGNEVAQACENLQDNPKTESITEDESKQLYNNDSVETDSQEEEDFSFEEYSIDEEPENISEINQDEDSTDDYSDPDEDSKLLPKYEVETPTKGKLVFSINERFRFKKALFQDSDVDFNNTLALVASMESYEEAEEYFLNEEGLMRNDPVVIEFLEIIKRYFK